jgi:carbonic anhydrase
MNKAIILALLGAVSSVNGASWDYAQQGADWTSDIDASYTCLGGDYLSQSPIDIVTASATPGPVSVSFEYTDPSSVTVDNNGHTLQVSTNAGQVVFTNEDGAKTYVLLQFHFHAPSEHTVDGIQHDLEIHMVHTDGIGGYAVVGIFFDVDADSTEGSTTSTDEDTTDESTEDTDSSSSSMYYTDSEFLDSLDLANIGSTLSSILLTDLTDNLDQNNFYTYSGSLTTPPCSEVVTWLSYATQV